MTLYVLAFARVLILQAEQDFYPPLALFGELHTENPLEGDAQLQLGMACHCSVLMLSGKMFPLFTNMVQFVERCYVVLKNLIRQLANLYHPQQKVWQLRAIGSNRAGIPSRYLLYCLEIHGPALERLDNT